MGNKGNHEIVWKLWVLIAHRRPGRVLSRHCVNLWKMCVVRDTPSEVRQSGTQTQPYGKSPCRRIRVPDFSPVPTAHHIRVTFRLPSHFNIVFIIIRTSLSSESFFFFWESSEKVPPHYVGVHVWPFAATHNYPGVNRNYFLMFCSIWLIVTEDTFFLSSHCGRTCPKTHLRVAQSWNSVRISREP